MAKLRKEDVMAAAKMKEVGFSVRSLAGKFGVDESTLRYRLVRLKAGAKDGRGKQPEACEPYDSVIMAWIEDQKKRLERRERPRSVRELYELLVVEHGYTRSYKAVVRYMKRRRHRPKMRPVRRVEVRPGSQAQVDWVQVTANVVSLGGLVDLWVFVMVLSSSRMWAAIRSPRKDMYSWIHCHNEAFQRLGGVSISVRPDNEKTATVKGGGPWAKLNEGYASYAGQMGFIIDPARIRTPQDKGKVERRNQDLEYVQIRFDEVFPDIEALQRATDERVLKRADNLLCPRTGLSIAESWRMERQVLLPLPEVSPEAFDVQVRREVGRDCLLNFESHQYTVPFLLMGRTVEVRGAGDRVLILHEGAVVKSYPRGTREKLLVDQTDYDGNGDARVSRPTPLGKMGKMIVLERSWEASVRPIDHYAMLVGSER